MLLQSFKIRIKRIPPVRYFHNEITYWKWLCCNKPVPPPPIVKQMVIEEYAGKYNVPVFVETGTYRGDTIYAVKNLFGKIYSIELDATLYEKAKQRFSKYPNISILRGDSAKVLPDILSAIKQPCLFWLDAHYSGKGTTKSDKETPICEEIDIIARCLKVNCVILIDDARDFKGQNDYPALEKLRQFVLSRYPAHTFEVKDDIIRIYEDK